MLKAVEFLHLKANGIMHRGIKPENILCNDDTHFVLAGFSLASFGSPPDDRRRHVDILEYLPPEVYEGEKETKAVDIWACGVLGLDVLRLLPKVAEKSRAFHLMKYLGWCDLVFEFGLRVGRPELHMMLTKEPRERLPASVILSQVKRRSDFQTRRFRPSKELIYLMLREDSQSGDMSNEEVLVSAATYLDGYKGQQKPPTLKRRGGGISQRQTQDGALLINLDSDPVIQKAMAEMEQLNALHPNLTPVFSSLGSQSSGSTGNPATVLAYPPPPPGGSAATAGPSTSQTPPPGSVSLHELLGMNPAQMSALFEGIPRRDLRDLKLSDMPQYTSGRGEGAGATAAVQPPQARAAQPAAPQDAQASVRRSKGVSLKTIRLDDFVQLTPEQQQQISDVPQLLTGRGSNPATVAAAAAAAVGAGAGASASRQTKIPRKAQQQQQQQQPAQAQAQAQRQKQQQQTQLVPPSQQVMTLGWAGPASSSSSNSSSTVHVHRAADAQGESGGISRGGGGGGAARAGGQSARGKKRGGK